MNTNKIKYSDLIELGFKRTEIEDEFIFQETGYYGFVLEMEFNYLKLGISTECFVSNENKQWDFKLYDTESGDIIRRAEFIELNELIEYFEIKDAEIFNCFKEVELLKKTSITKLEILDKITYAIIITLGIIFMILGNTSDLYHSSMLLLGFLMIAMPVYRLFNS